MTTLGNRIKYERIQQKVSMTEIEQHIGVSTGCLSKIESGKSTNIKLETLIAIRDALGFETIDKMLEPLDEDEARILASHGRYDIFRVKRRKIGQ